MRVITIDEGKKEKMSEYAEKMLKYGGKLMQCIESLNEEEDESMGERYDERMGRGRYGERYGERDDYDMEDDEEFGMRSGRDGYGRRDGMGMRRSRRTGRYIR